MSSTSELLPEPVTPVTTVTTPSGNRTSTFLRLCCRAPLITIAGPPASRPAGRRFVGTGIAVLPLRYGPVSDWADALTLAGVPAAVIWPPPSPEPGPKSTRWSAASITSRSCSTRTSVLPRSRRCRRAAEQPGVVARVQADRRLVEHVEHAGQAAADLAGQADPLALAAGERRRAAGQRQVIEADVDQERAAGCGPRAPGRRRCAARRASSFSSLKNARAWPSGQWLIWSSVKPWNRTAAASSRSRPPMQAAQGTSSTIPWSLNR